MTNQSAIEKWRNILNNWKESKLTIAEFCIENSLDKSNFYQWRKRLSIDDNHSFVTIVPDYQRPQSVIVLQLPGSVHIEVNNTTDFVLLNKLLKSLGGNT